MWLLDFLLVCLIGGGAVFVVSAADDRRGASGRGMPGASAVATRSSTAATRPGTTGTDAVVSTLHYAVNVGSSAAMAASMGFNLYDVGGSTSDPVAANAIVRGLPAGGRALVWVGNLDNAPKGSSCPAPGFTYSQFTGQVDALANNPRVFGYYISDEPHPSVCPNAVADIKARADYIHAHAPGQYAFIVVQDGYAICGSSLGCEYQALQPAHTDVDYVGLDPYPCHVDGSGDPLACDDSVIASRVDAAERTGIPVSAIVPVFQTFGQQGRSDGKTVYYRLPSAAELEAMLDTWAGLVPDPGFDYFYTFGVQCRTSSCPAPQAIANEPSLRSVVSAHNEAG